MPQQEGDKDEPLPIDDFTMDPLLVEHLEKYYLTTDARISPAVTYIGNPQLLLPKLSFPGTISAEFNAKRDPYEFKRLPAGLQVAIDDNDAWPMSHQTRLEIKARAYCKPEMMVQVEGNEGLFPLQGLQQGYDREQMYWFFEFYYTSPSEAKRSQVYLILPLVDGCEEYHLRYASRTLAENAAPIRHRKNVLMARRITSGPKIAIDGPYPEDKSWVHVLFQIHAFFHPLPHQGWLYSGRELVDPRYEFDTRKIRVKLSQARVLAQFFDLFAKRVLETEETFHVESEAAVEFYNFCLHLGETLDVFAPHNGNYLRIQTARREWLDLEYILWSHMCPIIHKFNALSETQKETILNTYKLQHFKYGFNPI